MEMTGSHFMGAMRWACDSVDPCFWALRRRSGTYGGLTESTADVTESIATRAGEAPPVAWSAIFALGGAAVRARELAGEGDEARHHRVRVVAAVDHGKRGDQLGRAPQR